MVGTDKTGQPQAHSHIQYCILEYLNNSCNNSSATNAILCRTARRLLNDHICTRLLRGASLLCCNMASDIRSSIHEYGNC